jgi:hypothetical protein
MFARSATAVTYSWNSDAPGNWNVAANWSPGTGHPDGIDHEARDWSCMS